MSEREDRWPRRIEQLRRAAALGTEQIVSGRPLAVPGFEQITGGRLTSTARPSSPDVLRAMLSARAMQTVISQGCTCAPPQIVVYATDNELQAQIDGLGGAVAMGVGHRPGCPCPAS